MNDDEIEQLLLQSQCIHKGIGGESFHAIIDSRNVFIKIIALTDKELFHKPFPSTINLFGLPLFYQYGIGSTGFGVGRELASCEQATKWVFQGICPNFPLLFHWRIMPKSKVNIAPRLTKDLLDKEVLAWNNSPAVHERLTAINQASHCILLAEEYFPQSLSSWLTSEIKISPERAIQALEHVERNLLSALDVMAQHGMAHFDVHFGNIVTDGGELYISDFGLALSTTFDLSLEEQQFLEHHKLYDRAWAGLAILYTALTAIFDRSEWISRLKTFLNGDEDSLPAFIKPMANKWGTIAVVMDQFLFDLQHISKKTIFPEERIAHILPRR